MKAFLSNYGAPVNIFAPGTNIISTWKDGKTKTLSGTSQSTPHVAGYAACLLAIDSSLTPAQIAKIIDDNALKSALRNLREFFVPCCMFDLWI